MESNVLYSLLNFSRKPNTALKNNNKFRSKKMKKIQDKMDQTEVVLFFLISYYIYNCFLPV